MKGDVVVVTGASGALGRVLVRMAAERGARVATVDHGKAPADELASAELRLGGVDLTDFEAARRAIDAVAERLGAVHVLFNVAGGFRWQKLADGDLAVWDRLYAMNVKTAVNACKAALPHLVESGAGRIVNVGAVGALKAGVGMGAYAASKQGVLKLTESLAEELKGKVTVNAVLPSIIDTPANRADMPGSDFTRWVSPEDLAAVMLFLASREARAVTGALVPVTGEV